MNQPDRAAENEIKHTPLTALFRKYYYFTLIAALIGGAMQMILLLADYDPSIGMYDHTSRLNLPFKVFAWIVSAALITFPIVCKKKLSKEISQTPSRPNLSEVFASALCGFILLATLIIQLIGGKHMLSSGSLSLNDYFRIGSLILAVPSAIFFFLPAFSPKCNERVNVALSFFPVLWCACCAMGIFFNNSIALRSPVKNLMELGLIAAMLFFLMELRAKIMRPRPLAQMLFTNLGIFFTAISAIPLISVAFIKRWPLSANVLYCAVLLCFMVYFIARANTYSSEN